MSKQQAVIPSQVFELPDGSNSYQDFSLTRNNRFSSAQSGRNIIQAPAAVLHFHNAPPTFNQHQMQKVLALDVEVGTGCITFWNAPIIAKLVRKNV